MSRCCCTRLIAISRHVLACWFSRNALAGTSAEYDYEWEDIYAVLVAIQAVSFVSYPVCAIKAPKKPAPKGRTSVIYT